ncbi:hypothetical protein [Rhodoblastus sp.]|uniref:hypothetical protein n=1 Tax=Rhodoblastus sp. TaxID=1962975 RepID=UPI003F9D8974
MAGSETTQADRNAFGGAAAFAEAAALKDKRREYIPRLSFIAALAPDLALARHGFAFFRQIDRKRPGREGVFVRRSVVGGAVIWPAVVARICRREQDERDQAVGGNGDDPVGDFRSRDMKRKAHARSRDED